MVQQWLYERTPTPTPTPTPGRKGVKGGFGAPLSAKGVYSRIEQESWGCIPGSDNMETDHLKSSI